MHHQILKTNNVELKCGIVFASTITMATTAVAAPKEDSKPNIIIIFCDDLGYGDLACFGHPTIKTPYLDQLAAEGQKWSSFYVSASVSSPSRAGLLTGRLGVRTGLYGNRIRVLYPKSKLGIPDEELTIAEILKDNGYATGCVGKWHLGHKSEGMPLAHGFDYFYGAPFSNDMSRKEQALDGNPNYPYDYIIYEQDEIVERELDQTTLTKKVNDKAIAFIEDNIDKPFFLYLAHPMPHWPVYAAEEFQGRSARGPYGDCIEELDYRVGEIIQTLERNGLDDNTLVVFTSDNGPWLTYKSLGGSAGPLSEGKAAIMEGGFRVPCIMWGDMVKPAHITDMGSTLDLLPTICDIADIEVPNDREYDGVSLKNVLEERTASNRDEVFYFRNDFLYAMRKGDYKILFAYKTGYGRDPREEFEIPRLYNIAQDPEERYEISAENPEIVKELTEYAEAYKASLDIKSPLFDVLD